MNSIESKIINLDGVSVKAGDSVVLCHGHFNIIHPGHIRYLDYASQKGAKLVVSVQGDASFLNSERILSISSLDKSFIVVTTGKRPINSGIMPKEIISSCRTEFRV